MTNTTNNNKYRCCICGKNLNDVDSYLTHVAACGAKLKKDEEEEKKKEYLAKLNAEISKVKAAQDYANECLKKFKEKYPKEYELNFAPKKETQKEKCSCNSQPKNSHNNDYIKVDLTDDDAVAFLKFLDSFLTN